MSEDEKKGYIYDFDNLNKRISELENLVKRNDKDIKLVLVIQYKRIEELETKLEFEKKIDLDYILKVNQLENNDKTHQALYDKIFKELTELEKKVNDWINGQAILDERIEKLEEVVREFNKCLWRGGVITIEYKDRIEEKLEDDTKFGFTEWEKHNECIYVKRDDLEELLIERIDYTKAFNKFRKKFNRQALYIRVDSLRQGQHWPCLFY